MLTCKLPDATVPCDLLLSALELSISYAGDTGAALRGNQVGGLPWNDQEDTPSVGRAHLRRDRAGILCHPSMKLKYYALAA